jgi:hypothetical protein
VDRPPGSRIRAWVATVEPEQVVGFISLGPSLDEDAERSALQVYALYLDHGM